MPRIVRHLRSFHVVRSLQLEDFAASTLEELRPTCLSTGAAGDEQGQLGCRSSGSSLGPCRHSHAVFTSSLASPARRPSPGSVHPSQARLQTAPPEPTAPWAEPRPSSLLRCWLARGLWRVGDARPGKLAPWRGASSRVQDAAAVTWTFWAFAKTRHVEAAGMLVVVADRRNPVPPSFVLQLLEPVEPWIAPRSLLQRRGCRSHQ
ncbi:uncharacterized protein UV8b_03582 [Ustilaginoidea virens]|uniref:Uncharacterized protein n=1 Tax=Ustilaginoidea virens TaxID=1159556 RepID=A0A8E5MH62_USTVR|nr:uncharacterized protein UV8b_03582 [Ustilaginoidea virens]QUC19341.1 hypothetical protein UV8b_03582 [Ustilaginoidea virens]